MLVFAEPPAGAGMHLETPFPPLGTYDGPPRAVGELVVSSKARGGKSCIDRFRAAGSAKAAFPDRSDALEAIVVNTSGGLTGGDRFRIEARAGTGSRLVMTTQAAERAYRSVTGLARVSTRLHVERGASLAWLPQELIVFDGAALTRRLDADLAPGAEFLMVEPVVFGRAAMGEEVTDATFRDRVSITRDGRPLYSDALDLQGDVRARLARSATARGMTAMATVVFVSPSAEGALAAVREGLSDTGGASLLAPDTLAVRLMAGDGFLLRSRLCPLVEALTGTDLPKSWRL